jgi:hypothetical protein
MVAKMVDGGRYIFSTTAYHPVVDFPTNGRKIMVVKMVGKW